MANPEKVQRRSNFRRVLGCGAFLGAQLIAATPGWCEIAMLRPKKDATLIENANGTLANGSGPAIFSGRISASTDSIRRALLLFDVASMVPAGSTVTKVVLSLNLSATNGGAATINIRHVTAEWGEGASSASGGSGGQATQGDCTWLHRFYDQTMWVRPGGDYAESLIATSTVDQPGVYLWDTNEAMVDEVQAWLDHPEANFGWILIGDEARATTVKRFDSRETPVEANRPILYVEYVPPCSPSPLGPGAWALQCDLLLGDSGLHSGALDALEPGFADAVLPCAQAMLLDLGIEDSSPCAALAPSTPLDCRERAIRTLSSLALNVCAARLQSSCEFAPDGPACGPANVGDMIEDLADSYLSGECRPVSACSDRGRSN